MHKLIFKEVSFRNFMSYGSTLNKFTFKDGLTWVHGDNGFGKSTIVEAMTFALLGTSYRGGTKADLRNSKNFNQDEPEKAPPTVVELVFDIENPPNPTESYRVTRTISGAKSTIKFVLEKLEGETWVAQNKRAGFTQQDFEENILQFNDVLFKNVIAMNTQETQPFFMLPAAKKRELLESIISLSLDKWKKANGKKASDAKLAFTVAESDINQISAEISELNTIYKQMKSEHASNLAQMKREYSSLMDEIAKKVAERDTKETLVNSLRAEIRALNVKLAKEREVDQKIATINDKMSAVQLLADANDVAAEKKEALAALSKQLDPKFRERGTYQGELTIVTDDLLNEKKKLQMIEDEIKECNIQIRLKQKELDKIAEEGKSFVVGKPCPTCGHIATEDEVNTHKDALRTKWKSANKELVPLKTGLADLTTTSETQRKKIESLEAKVTELNEKIDEINRIDTEIFKPAQTAFNMALQTVAKYEKKLDGADVDGLTKELNDCKAEKAKFPKIRDEYTAKTEALNSAVGEYSAVDEAVNQMQTNSDKLKDDIEKAESVDDNSIAVMEKKIQKNKAMLADAKARRAENSDTMALCETITQICADDGMKKMIFGMFVPTFNKIVARNLAKAGLPFIVKFGDAMDYTFQTLPGLSPNYTMLSQGQKRRLGFAVSMAFRDFVSMVGNFNVNFLSLDEVLDISTDDTAMHEMLDLAKLMMADIGCAMIISHRGKVVADKFDYHLEVSYNGMYSRLGDILPMHEKALPPK